MAQIESPLPIFTQEAISSYDVELTVKEVSTLPWPHPGYEPGKRMNGAGCPVLITGATGFVGCHLVAACAAAGDSVTGIGRTPPGSPNLPTELDRYRSLDLTDAVQVASAVREAGPARVFHLAAEASVGTSWEAPKHVLESNALTALNVLEAVRHEAPEARVLVACSGEEYGPVPEVRLPITEDVPLRPQSPYAVSKAAADLLSGFYQDVHGLHITRARAFNHAGPGQSDTYVVSALARQVAEAERHSDPDRASVKLRTGNLRVKRDFTDVRDVVRAYRLVLESARPGIYNVCSGRSVPLTAILVSLAKASSLKIEHLIDPDRLRRHDIMELRGSHERLTRATGWQPRIDFERTVRDALEWWRKEVGK